MLSADVASGNSYAGMVFRLTNDINTFGIAVGTDDQPFSGIFDGNGHTLTFNAGTASDPVAKQQTAPFLAVSNATIRHLHTTGTIYTNAKFAAGIAARISGSAYTQLFDCHSDVSIRSSIVGDGTHGGLVAVVSRGVDSLVAIRCSFTGSILNSGSGATVDCGGLVGWSYVPVHITVGVFDPQGMNSNNAILSGATFARMENYSRLTLSSCYATRQLRDRQQGSFVISGMDVPNGVTYEFQGEPEVTLDGRKYYKNGCRVKLDVADGTPFNHWYDNNGCFDSDPLTASGIHQLKDLRNKPSLAIITTGIPAPETERTLWGVTYRYLSRLDYHYYVSDEDCAARGWKFENSDRDANLVVYDEHGDPSEITAITGYDEDDYDSDGLQIHNDLVGVFRAHTHLGMIAPHAFRNSTALKTLYFKDTDANNYNTLLPFDFYITCRWWPRTPPGTLTNW